LGGTRLGTDLKNSLDDEKGMIKDSSLRTKNRFMSMKTDLTGTKEGVESDTIRTEDTVKNLGYESIVSKSTGTAITLIVARRNEMNHFIPPWLE